MRTHVLPACSTRGRGAAPSGVWRTGSPYGHGVGRARASIRGRPRGQGRRAGDRVAPRWTGSPAGQGHGSAGPPVGGRYGRWAPLRARTGSPRTGSPEGGGVPSNSSPGGATALRFDPWASRGRSPQTTESLEWVGLGGGVGDAGRSGLLETLAKSSTLATESRARTAARRTGPRRRPEGIWRGRNRNRCSLFPWGQRDVRLRTWWQPGRTARDAPAPVERGPYRALRAMHRSRIPPGSPTECQE